MTECLTQLTTNFDFKALVPTCQHGGKVGFCEECEKEITPANYDWVEKQREESARDDKELDNRHREHPERFMEHYIPKKFIDRSLDNFTGSDPIKKLCLDYSHGFVRSKVVVDGRPLGDRGLSKHPGSILFMGKTGCGKTHLAVAIIRELVKRRAISNVKFITAPELLLEIRSTFKSRKKKWDGWEKGEETTESEVLDKYSQCELLILDDLGAEKVSDFTIQSLYLVIDRRNRDLRPTIVTTNLSLEEIESQIDARMASRLSDMKVVKLTMPDYRKKREAK